MVMVREGGLRATPGPRGGPPYKATTPREVPVCFGAVQENEFVYEQEVRVVSKLSRSWSKAKRHSLGNGFIPQQVQVMVDNSRHESGQNADGYFGTWWTSPDTKVDKMPVREDEV